MTLTYLDECGFSPSQPVNYSWTAQGQRKYVPYAQGRRVNVLAALVADGSSPSLTWGPAPRTLTAQDLVRCVQEGIPRGTGELVLDNASIHRTQVVQDALPGLQAQGIRLYYLPPYSPKLNLIEPIFGGIKGHGLPERAYPSTAALIEAIDDAFATAEARLQAKHLYYLR